MLRRTTLGPLDSQFNSSQSSHLPQPSNNSSKQQSMSRQSLIGRPSLGRPSLGPALRKSNVNGLSSDMHGLSLQDSRVSIGGRQSFDPRRSSSYGAARQSMPGNGGSSSLSKDPRAIREKQWQATVIKSLVTFLMEAGYEYALTPKILSAPSIRDFQNIFMFLYNRLDPGYLWKNKFEDDVLLLAKSIKYPFADQITKSTLQAVGSLHAWPFLLAFLVWIVELIIVCESVDEEVEAAEQSGADPDRLFADFLVKGYDQYMLGKTDYESLETEMQDLFRENQVVIANEIEKLQADNTHLTSDYKSLTSEESPLLKLKQKQSEVTEDIGKVKKWIETLTVKKNQLQEQTDKLQEELNEANAETEKLSTEKVELQHIVDGQEISAADIDRMNAERDQLTKSIEQFNEKNEELTKMNWNYETESQKKLDTVEKLAQDYNAKAYRLDLIPASAANANGMNFEVILDPHASKIDQMVSVDLRGPIKQTLMQLRTRFKNDLLQAEDSRVSQREDFDRIMESINEKLDELNQIEMRVQKAHEQYESDKNAASVEFEAISSEIEALDKEIRRVKVERSRGIFDCQKEIREYEIEYKCTCETCIIDINYRNDNLTRRLGELRERQAKQARKVLEDVRMFKKQILGPLEDLKLAVESDHQTLQSEYETILAASILEMPTHETCIADTSFYGGSNVEEVLKEMDDN